MKMTEKNERLQHLFKYFELLIELKGKDHQVSRELFEVVQAIRQDLELGSQPRAVLDSNGLYVQGGTFTVESPSKENKLNS